MVKVCDAIMGTGKSQSAITYINEHQDKKFIYITPYLSEAARIKRDCPRLRFIEPSQKLPQYNYKKTAHTAALIEDGRNVTTTHQAFKAYSPELLENIKRQGYTLIIDENIDVLETLEFDEFKADDLQLAVDAGYVIEDRGTYKLSNNAYQEGALSEMFKLLKRRNLVKVECDDYPLREPKESKDSQESEPQCLFYWTLPPEFITSFESVFILTYMFEGQSLHHMMEINHIPFEYIGVARDEGTATGFRFARYPGYTPCYVSELKEKIHIIENSRVNNVGNDYYALSMNKFSKNGADIKQLKRNISNCFKNIWRKTPAKKRLCGAYKNEFDKIKGKGYTKALLPFNVRATNEYRDRTHLAYTVNIFMNTNEKIFYRKRGIEVDEDMYALSIMVQWIWRSAIRDGKDIYVYIPSSRMRALLKDWIDDVSREGNSVGTNSV